MTPIPPLFLAAALLAAALASIGIWAPRRTSVKVSALLVTFLLLPVAYASFVELLSRPKPVTMEWARAKAEEATVLSSTMTEGRGIYLWLQMDEVIEPRAYVLPWDREMAEQLQAAERQADGGGVRMRLPFEPSLDDRKPRFYPLPQPAMPPKDLLDRPAADADALAQEL